MYVKLYLKSNLYFQSFCFIVQNLVDHIKLSPLLQRNKPPVLTYRQQFDRRLGIVTFFQNLQDFNRIVK